MTNDTTSIHDQLRDGVSPGVILSACEDAESQAAAFEVICASPRPDMSRGTRWQHAALTAIVAGLVLLFALELLAALLGDGPLPQSLVGLGGNCIVLVGLRGRLLATYVGLPLWTFLMAVGDLRALGNHPSPADLMFLGVSLTLFGVATLLATSLRRRLFPYSTWRGVPRTASGEAVVPAELLVVRPSLGGAVPPVTPTAREESLLRDQITVQVSREARNTLIGKAVCLLVFGVIAGYSYHVSVLADNARAAALTLQEYTADFEEYKAGLVQEEWPLWGHVTLLLVMLGGFFGVYEALGWVCGRVTGRLLPSSADGESLRGSGQV